MFKEFFRKIKQTKLQKSLERGLKDIKEGKVHSYESVEEMIKKDEQWRKTYPVLNFFKQIYYEIFFRIPNRIEGFFFNVKYFIQRGKRGYADCDLWGFDTYLARIIVDGITEIKKSKYGIPRIVFKNSDKGYKDGSFDEKTMDFVDKRYKNILNEIIWTFKTYQECHQGNLLVPPLNKYYTDKELKQSKDFCNRINKTVRNIDGPYKMISEEDFKRYLNGWKLFKDYFSALNY